MITRKDARRRANLDLSTYGWPAPRRRRSVAVGIARLFLLGFAAYGVLVASGTLR